MNGYQWGKYGEVWHGRIIVEAEGALLATRLNLNPFSGCSADGSKVSGLVMIGGKASVTGSEVAENIPETTVESPTGSGGGSGGESSNGGKSGNKKKTESADKWSVIGAETSSSTSTVNQAVIAGNAKVSNSKVKNGFILGKMSNSTMKGGFVDRTGEVTGGSLIESGVIDGKVDHSRIKGDSIVSGEVSGGAVIASGSIIKKGAKVSGQYVVQNCIVRGSVK